MLYLFGFENGLFYSCSAWESANRALGKNMAGMDFIHLLKEIGALSVKNAKPQYANEI